MRLRRKSYRNDDDEDPRGEELAAVNDRLDELTRHIERIAEATVAGRAAQPAREPRRDEREQRGPDHVTEALARLDRRLDQIITDTRATAEAERRAAIEAERRAVRMAPPPPAYTPPPPAYTPAPPATPPGPAGWAAEISARQRALEGGPQAAAAAAAPQWRQPQPQAPAPDLSGLEQHLRQITSQIASLHQPYEDALTALRGDLAEIARALTEAMPRQAIEQLESEVRTLAQRVDRSKQGGGVDPHALAPLEQGLAEIREALRHLMPAENLAGFEEVVRGLSHKIDQIASASHDPGAFQQIEHAIHSMRGVVQNIASDGALSQLAAEVHGLSQRVEHAAAAAAANTGSDALAKLEIRLAALMESGRSVPPELEQAIHELSARIDQMQTRQDQRAQLSHSDQLVLGGLEDRIVKLAEKLDASDQRLNNLASMERGIADLLVMLEEMRNGSRGPRVGAPAAETPAPKPEPEPVPPLAIAPPAPPPAPPQAPQHHLPPVHHLEAPPPPDKVFSTIPAAAQPMARQAAPQPQERKPLNPNLPPDTPLEPGVGMPYVKPGSPAARIAASEAALGSARPAATSNGGAAAARAAARNAKSSFVDTPVIPSKNAKFKKAGGWFTKSPKKKKPVEPIPALEIKPEPVRAPEIPPPVAPYAADGTDAPKKTIGQHIKTLLIAASVVAIVLGVVQTAINLMSSDETPSASAPGENLNINTAPSIIPPSVNPPGTTPSAPSVPSRPMPTPEGTVPPPDDGTTNSIRQQQSSFFDPRTVVQPKATPPAPPPADVTGSIPRHTPRTPTLADGLPQTIAGPLRAGIAAQDPAAEYELAVRYSEGRGVTQSAEESVRWLDRAAKAGFVPAQFRLASAMEKGDGIKRDMQGARRLYTAAAEKGHAKAMHNLAVLYAEGIDGKPDYRMAAQWFRKAASLGVADSQFNLAILYARGIGTEPNLAESYKWFALAAAKGDKDAEKKRDEVGARLDQKNLTAARLAAQTFTPEPEAEDATNLKVPAGGWDRPAVAGAKPKQRTP